MPVLHLSGLSRRFGGITVLSDLDFEIRKGEILGILGPNGAGKSTLFNLISGVLPPSAGAIIYKGTDITRMKPWDRCQAGIGRTYQIPKPFSHMTVFENTLLAAVHGARLSSAQARTRSMDVLHRTGLAPLAAQTAGTLRLLDLKRLELARALAGDPEVLLLDEIAGGLTEAECHSLVDMVMAIRDEGRTIVWVEHVMTALRRACSRLAVIYGGGILTSGTPAEVLADPQLKAVYLGADDAE
ncbi:MAG: ABC transporter ATP-binding protein [Devosia sp.]|nr:ABC transporter ATP-binding protein [Devosia sp.]